MLGVGDVMASVANARTDGAHSDAVDHLAGVTVVPEQNENIRKDGLLCSLIHSVFP